MCGVAGIGRGWAAAPALPPLSQPPPCPPSIPAPTLTRTAPPPSQPPPCHGGAGIPREPQPGLWSFPARVWFPARPAQLRREPLCVPHQGRFTLPGSRRPYVATAMEHCYLGQAADSLGVAG
ncbi:unnamed protein product [Natator depressus]